MSVIRWLVPGFFFVAFLLIMFLLFRNGAFKPVEIRLEDRPPTSIVFTENIGPYHKVLGSLQKVENWAKENNYRCELTFGRYLDDPDVVDPERLRSEVGCIFDTPPAPTNPLPDDLKQGDLPGGKFVVGIFHGSPALGPYKVYGKAADFIRENRLTHSGAVIEVYRVISEREVETHYLFPVK